MSNQTNPIHLLSVATAMASALFSSSAFAAETGQGNPISKFFVTSIEGSAKIEKDQNVQDLKSRTVHNAEGVIIETRHLDGTNSSDKGTASMVYSNGTGIFFDPDTKLEVKKFIQQPFTPNRTDLDFEPSVSHTQTFLSRGIIGLCTSKMVAGSSMIYQTPLGEVNIRGRKIVIESNEKFTRIAMIEGESTVRPGTSGGMDLGSRNLGAGQQAIIRPGVGGQAPTIQIEDIPANELSGFNDKISMACVAKRTVYFDAVTPTDGRVASNKTSDTSSNSEGSGDASGNGGSGLFSTFAGAAQEIVPVMVVPVDLPVQFTVSPAILPKN